MFFTEREARGEGARGFVGVHSVSRSERLRLGFADSILGGRFKKRDTEEERKERGSSPRGSAVQVNKLRADGCSSRFPSSVSSSLE